MKNYAKCLIEDSDNRILLLKRADSDEHGGMWETAGGGVELDEDLDVAIKREVKEETGLDVDVAYQINITLSDDAIPGKLYKAHLFKATSYSGEVKLLPEEHSAFAWVHRTELFDFIAQGNEIERWTLSHLLAE